MSKKTILVCDRCYTSSQHAYISDEITFGGEYSLSIVKYDPEKTVHIKLDLCLNCFDHILKHAQVYVSQAFDELPIGLPPGAYSTGLSGPRPGSPDLIMFTAAVTTAR